MNIKELIKLAELNLKSIRELREEQKKTDEQMKKTDELMKQTDEQMKRTDEQMKRTDEKLERMGIRLGGIQNNQGEIAEEFFYTSFDIKKQLGNIQYDDIGKNWTKKRNGIQEEFDIILTNGKAIAVIEVKVKAHPNDIEKLERKVRNFPKLFPIYKDFKIYGGMATMKLEEDVKTALQQKGFYAITQQGNHLEIINP